MIMLTFKTALPLCKAASAKGNGFALFGPLGWWGQHPVGSSDWCGFLVNPTLKKDENEAT